MKDYLITGLKTCNGPCGLEKPIEEFYWSNKQKTVKSSSCKSCNTTRVSKYRRDNPQIAKQAYVKHRHGINKEELSELEYKLKGSCDICKNLETARTPDGQIKNLSIDHDHSCCPANKSCSKCRRGLLCQACNMMIGGSRDRIENLLKGIEYLDHYGNL